MTTLREALTSKLTQQELQQLRTSFDMIGSIAILEIPHELTKKQKTIAQAALSIIPHATTVLKKGKHTGQYRTQHLQHLAGKRTKITEHKESGIRLQLNVETCYFTPRLVTERARITSLIKPKENILVLGSGIAPYPLSIAKHTKAQHITGIEVNPEAHKWAQKNITLNKTEKKITLHNTDAESYLQTTKQKFNRIIIPLPADNISLQVLPASLKNIKKKGMLHIYQFANENSFKEAEQAIQNICKKEKKTCKILRTVKAGQHKPRAYRICTDVQVT